MTGTAMRKKPAAVLKRTAIFGRRGADSVRLATAIRIPVAVTALIADQPGGANAASDGKYQKSRMLPATAATAIRTRFYSRSGRHRARPDGEAAADRGVQTSSSVGRDVQGHGEEEARFDRQDGP